MQPLDNSPIKYTKSWPPVSGSQPTQIRKPHSNVSTIVPSGIKPRMSSVLSIPDDIGVPEDKCDQIISNIHKLTETYKQKQKQQAGSKRFKRRSVRRRKSKSKQNKRKFRNTRVRS
jgi:hypothetical protein